VRTTTKHPFGTDNPLKTKEARLLRGPYTQTELSTLLCVSVNQINDWEHGACHPTMSNLRALLKHYNTWTADLAGPALDFVLPQNPKRLRRTPWHRSKSSTTPEPSQSSQAKVKSA
jgi:transcriptional regulator with XRE-family HTH domain